MEQENFDMFGDLTKFSTRQCPPTQELNFTQPSNAAILTTKERDELILDQNKRENELPLLVTTKSAISLFSWDEMQRIASYEITNSNDDGNGSINDARTGVVTLNVRCQYCGQIDCPGHYGLINFGFGNMIYNPCYIRDVVSVLTCVCNNCSGLLLSRDIIKSKFSTIPFTERLAKMEKESEGLTCVNKKVKLLGGPIEPCAKNPVYISADVKKNSVISYKTTDQKLPNQKPIEEVLRILDNISDEDAELLGFPAVTQKYTVINQPGSENDEDIEVPGPHPRNMILRGLLVPPLIARPPVMEGNKTYHDHITYMYKFIVNKVDIINSGKINTRVKALDNLYQAVKGLIFKTEGRKFGPHEFLSIVERIQGKKALIREYLMGKRVDYCGRTVLGPDASLQFGQIGIPLAWTNTLTKKWPVTNFNIDYLKDLLKQGRITHIIPRGTKLRRFCGNKCTYELKIGDVVERYLMNTDRVVANRQPTLHRQSMMGFNTVLGPQLTLRFHLSYTTPLNADFDGDEGNIWCPQDFEVEAEVEILMNVVNNIMSSEQNKPIMGLVMNSILGSYLLTSPDTYVDDNLFSELLSFVGNKDELNSLSYRLNKYGVHPRSGKAVFSALLPSDFTYELKGVKIYDGILISGQINKSHVGASHRSIIQELHKKYRGKRTAQFFTEAAWVLNKWLIEYGFSVGIMDMVNFRIDDEKGEEYDKNERVLKNELAELYVKLEALGGKVSDPNEELYRQSQINNIVDIAQSIGIRLAKEMASKNGTIDATTGLPRTNSIGVMTEDGSGTKGANANIGQMMGAVGQQYYHGLRLQPTLAGGTRFLPVYDRNDITPEANGFIPMSLFTGLKAPHLFSLQAGGREGLLDTALKTSETGSMHHRMIKAFENIKIANDGSIRNALGTMFCPIYNSGYDVGELMSVATLGKPNLSSFIDVKALTLELNVASGWVPKDTNDKIVENRTKTSELHELEDILPTNSYVEPVVESKPYNIKTKITHTTPHIKLNKFEKCRIIGVRATQLSHNAPPLVDIGDELDPVNIAMLEYESGVLSRMFIVRKYADGSYDKIYATNENI